MGGKHRVVVLGAGYAGLAAATRLAKQVHPDMVSVDLVNARDHFVQRPRLHQVSTGQVVSHPSLAEVIRGTRIDLTVGWVHGIDLAGRRVEITTRDGETSLYYDTLVYALGSATDTRAVPGIDAHAHTLDPAEAPRIAERLGGMATGTVAVCGGGLTGIETAAEVAERYPDTTVQLITRGEPGDWLSPRARAYLGKAFGRLGIRVRSHSEITEVDDGAVRLSRGADVPFDLCLWAGGFRVPALAANAGLAVDERGRALVDPYLRSVSHPDVYVVGDAAAARGEWGDAIATPWCSSSARSMNARAADPWQC
ncbi:FAD-dependent oxidoreductase [Actinobacteria bacterium YIM 96077]|uniref:FAD-dependent oxidoreductase n=1 Tax=Phytoactinopolyspora halophila TaxID=1981511 RepID=A0A329QEW4_9ACTN|nr:FAD-dependent oxidoreductase [Phytoactinopolyspora halophila]AYY14169.1 FAD-dependent oxidoreductase [Actinobacteria bacterium YIM 96077]RAW10239.1 FAD-dependent oxidoreductase [Phytoactinopolyspora halophila]